MTINLHKPNRPVKAVPPPLVVDAELVKSSPSRRRVHLITTLKTSPTVRTGVRGTARNGWYIVAGAGVVFARWRDAHGSSRYERMMRAAEVAGDYDRLLDWEQRDVQEKARRHGRVMDWVQSPLQLVKALAIGIAAVAGLLLALGVVLAIGTGDFRQVIGPIVSLITAIVWAVWFFTAYGALLLTAVTVGAIAWLWQTGRTRATVPAWIAPASQGDERDVVPDEGAILRALQNLGLPALNKAVKDGWQPRWVQPTCRDGKGYRTQLQLPLGVTVEMINDKKTVLAHNLVRKPVEVWPIEPRDQAGVLDLWAADQGVLTRPIDPYPLLHDGGTDYFRGVPVGQDQRGDAVIGKLMASNYGIAGIMGSGKTSLVIDLLAGAMLDPLVDIDIYCMAFNADYDVMRPRLRTFIKGDEDEQVEAAIEALRGLRDEVTKRGKILADLGGDETKVTRRLAERDPRLRPRVIVFDECQEMFRHERLGKEAKELAIKVMMKARKCALTLVFVTPAPSADNLPRDLAKTTSHRVCFAIGDHQGNDAILGTGAHRSGVTATGLVAGEDVGTAMASGFAAKPGLLRAFHIQKDAEVDQLTPIVRRAVAMREEAGVEAPALERPAERDPLTDIATVLAGHKRLRTQEVLSGLSVLDRATYRGWTFERLAAALPDGARPYKSGGLMVVAADRVAEALAERATDGDDEAGAEGVAP
ncbi:zonular occludens toxin domain-containing protein [Pseudonocardia sp. TRM90224]|uniref:zonular occludens toxin domain-containing protein n=1 Tax=Pseudonocardia sp. TRM90224 TaxID=2812678 RepID=UPI001E5AD78B|nr:zonular occludens toxin domain-containing protein [Pseudonocardia sp. TRM90224]